MVWILLCFFNMDCVLVSFKPCCQDWFAGIQIDHRWSGSTATQINQACYPMFSGIRMFAGIIQFWNILVLKTTKIQCGFYHIQFEWTCSDWKISSFYSLVFHYFTCCFSLRVPTSEARQVDRKTAYLPLWWKQFRDYAAPIIKERMSVLPSMNLSFRMK